MNLPYYKNRLIVPLLLVGAFLASAVLFLSIANAAEEAQIQAAIEDLGSAIGQDISSEDQAKELCNQEQYLDVCADIGKKHSLYTTEEIKHVDDFLSEVKGKILNDIKTCLDEECLVKVANELAQKLKAKNPTLATDFNLTAKVIGEKNSVIQAAKEVGLNFRDCESMDPDTASVDLLRKCAKLAKDSRVQKYIPEDKRALASQFEDSSTIKLREALAAGRYQCGDNTLEGCGNFCLNPSAGATDIPQVCKQIAAEVFGPDGVKELEGAHRQVGQVKDFYAKKFILTLPNGKELVGEGQIRNACDQAFSSINFEVAKACGNFAVNNGFAGQAEVEKGLKLMESFTQKGQNVDFEKCLNDPRACRDLIPEDDRGRFDAGNQIFEIMKTEIGFDPQQCERGSVDPTIGTKCFEGSKRALAKIESLGLVSQSKEARFIVEDIKRHVADGEGMSQRKDEFRQVFSQQGGPGGCKSEAECYTYCSNSTNGPECISFGAKQNISGFRGKESIQRFQEYNQNVQKSSDVTSNEYRAYPSDGRYSQFPGQGPYPGFQPGYVPPGQVPGFTQPGPGFNQPPGIGQYYPGPGSVGPSPECFAAIQSGDYVKAKAVCESHTPQQPYPSSQICPANPYVECPAGQYRESFRNPDGCWVDGPCKPAPTYSSGPYPTYSRPPGEKTQCSDGVDNDNDGKTDYPADHSCYGPDDSDEYYPPEGAPYPTYSPYPTPGTSKCPSEFAYDMGGYCKLNSDTTNTKCAAYSVAGNKDNYSSDCSKLACPSGQWWDYSKSVCVSSSTTSPYPTYSPYPTATSGTGEMYNCFYPNATKNGKSPGYTVWCEKDYFNCHEGTNTGPSISLDGLALGAPSSCESGYWGKSCNNNKFCDSNETYTSCPSDCGGATYSPFPTYSSYPTPGTSKCPSEFAYDMGGYCKLNSDTTNTKCAAYSVAGNKDNYSSDCSKLACPSGQWWDYSKSVCVSSSTTSPYPTYSPYPTPSTTSCPSGYHPHGDSGGYCMNDQENYGGTCYNSAGTSKISCPVQPTYTPYPSCPSPQWWDTATSKCTSTTTSGSCPSGSHVVYVNSAGGYCMSDSDSSKCGPLNSTSTTNFGSCSSYQGSTTYSPAPTYSYSPGTSYTPYPSCPSGQWWDTAKSMCTSTATSCGSGYYWDSASSICKPISTTSYTPSSPSCPSGQWWDYTTNSCQGSTTTYTPPPYTPPPSCSSGQYWDGSACVTNPTPYPVTTTYTPYPTTEYTPPPTSGLYPHYMAMHCQQLGRTWNGEICEANGLFARFYEGSGMANILRLFYIVP